MNGTVTLVENIADSGGVHIAFQAYKDVNINQTLPNIDLSNDEIFFVSFGQVRGVAIVVLIRYICVCIIYYGIAIACRFGALSMTLNILNRVSIPRNLALDPYGKLSVKLVYIMHN